MSEYNAGIVFHTDEVYGELNFVGLARERRSRTQNGRSGAVAERIYNICSEKQQGNITVHIPAGAGIKTIPMMEKIKLVNPVHRPTVSVIAGSAVTGWDIYADNILEVKD